MEIRDSKDILEDIKELVNSKGYIYALCLIIMEDFHFDVEQMHEINYWNRLNKNEISLLLGFLIQNSISLEKPDSPFDLIDLKKKTNSLMEELHHSTNKSMYEKFRNLVETLPSENKPSKLEFFGGENSFIEPIFYSGDGIYDFQYLEYLERKYKYDEEWLIKNRNFRFNEVIAIASRIKQLHQEKIKKVFFFGLKENKDKIIRKIKKNRFITKSSQNKSIDKYLSMMEFYQFRELFETEKHIENGFSKEEVVEKGWNSFYNGLLNLFCISLDDFSEQINISDFLTNFSISVNSKGLNNHFKNIGDFNLFTAKPIIQFDSKRYFIPIVFSVFEAVYESPYYWMLEDKIYHDKLSHNRGIVGEVITYELLERVFGAKRVFKSIRIESKKGHDDTDIDVLCVLGSKALCVQVKSKKLTQLSRKGNFEQLQKDFKAAVQDAFKQGLICRERILEKSATFYDSTGSRIELSEEIDEVYILGITTENYPTLTHQTSILLEKNDNSPHPLFLTIFDLELVLFYLYNPYDFLYYVRQRIQLMEYFNANEEIHYLGYHLTNKLWRDAKADFIQIDTSLGQLIDRNYYPLKLGIETSPKGDRIKSRWQNKDFEVLCKQLDDLDTPKVTDVIFHLLDWSEQSRDNLINQIKKAKALTINDNSWHNFSIMAGPERSTFGLTYISWENYNSDELMKRLLWLSRGRKYKSKADYWIGIGCLKNSPRFVDGLVFSNEKWCYDELLEEEIKDMFDGENKGTPIKFSKKTGRNEQCPCGSRKKYKYCCGRSS